MDFKVSHLFIYISDYDQALQFYEGVLGFQKMVDAEIAPGYRWLNLCPPSQPDLKIVLMKAAEGMSLSEDQAAAIRRALELKSFCPAIFITDDVDRDFAALKAKGVHFRGEPEDHFYGRDVQFEDPFGNWFNLTTPKPH